MNANTWIELLTYFCGLLTGLIFTYLYGGIKFSKGWWTGWNQREETITTVYGKTWKNRLCWHDVNCQNSVTATSRAVLKDLN